MTPKHETRTVDRSHLNPCLVAVLSDTHGRPHPALFPILQEHRPSLILHAGDVGQPGLREDLEAIAQTVLVRGNMDPPGPPWPESVSLRLQLAAEVRLDLLLVHVAIANLKLTQRARDLVRRNSPQGVVFGHSHVPFIGEEGGVWLFNPGSAGPPRFRLPTTLGLMEITSKGLTFRHIDLRTARPWVPG